MKTVKLILTVLTIASLLMTAAPSVVFADDTIKIGEVQTYSRLTSFTFPYRNGWQLALERFGSQSLKDILRPAIEPA